MAALILKSFLIIPKYFVEMSHNIKPADRYLCSTTLSSSKNLRISHHMMYCTSRSLINTQRNWPASLFSNVKDDPKQNKKQLIRNYVSISKELEADHQQGLGIINFLKGKQFLITGATGFLGKVLIEKILRVAPDVRKIYVLIRSENAETAMERLKKEIMDVELFKCIRETHGKSYESFMMSKLVPIVGNICDSDIGLQEDVANTVTQEVDIIVNSAANTSFIQRYDIALNANTRGPSNLIRFAKRCKKVKLFLHVSTAYVNGERQGKIMEKPFRMGDSIARENFSEAPILDVEDEFKLALQFSKETSSSNLSMTQNMKELGLKRAKQFGWHNVYVFTKAMGEIMLDNEREDLPIVIIRPAAIEGTLKDPFPGWIEGIRMMDPLIINYGKGKLLGFVADPDAAIDMVPADMVVNAMLAAMTKHATMDKVVGGDIDIYHVGSSVANPINYRYLFERLLHEYFSSSPLVDSNGIYANQGLTVPHLQFHGRNVCSYFERCSKKWLFNLQ